MKMTMKRMISALLVLCSLLSVLPITGVATQQTTEAEKIIYDFVVKDTDLVGTNNKTLAGGILTNAPVANAITNYYADGTLNWKFAANNFSLLKTETNSLTDCSYFGGGSYAWQGLRAGVIHLEGGTKTYPAGFWVAMTIQVPKANTYNMTLNYQTRADGAKVGNVYLLPGVITDTAAIDAALTAQNLKLVVDFSDGSNLENHSAIAEDVALEAGEYTVVFKSAEQKKGAGGAYLFLNNLTFEVPVEVPEEPPQMLQVKELEYNFALNSTGLTYGTGKSFAGVQMKSDAIRAIESHYKAGSIFWKYAADNMDSFRTATNQVATATYFGGGNDKFIWSGLRMGMTVQEGDAKAYPPGYWEALTILSPGKGKYQLKLDYQTRSGATPAGEIYLIKGALKDSSQIEAAMTSKTLLKTVNFQSRVGQMTDMQVNLGLLDLEQGEYTLVFKAAEGSDSGSYIYITKLTATHESILPPPGPTEVTYDFDVSNRKYGIYSQAKDWEACKDDLAQRYEKGELAWKPEQKAATLTYDVSFKRDGGMTSYSNEDDWFAMRCKTPGTGLYTLTMQYAKTANGALCAVYILPSDTEDIEAAMDHSNRVKKVEFYNESGESGMEENCEITLGTWEFGTDEEFILVFECYDNSPFSNFAYLYISNIVAKEGDHTEDTGNDRKINAIVVNENAVKTYETTMYGTTAMVNGQDYLFIPIEGRKMAIYNLDDMVKVNTIRTPFSVCRGITTDKNGVVWLVGDKPVVFRYDPVSEVSTTTRNYGTQIKYCYGGFTAVTDDDGNLYFGTYQEAHVVKYNPVTDTFTATKYSDDAYYSSGVIIKDNYLYVGITGDVNGDGLRTSEMLRIDITTDNLEVVDRLDITRQVGQKENMVRGVGIGGNTLFAGGIQMEEFLAIDISGEKMAIKEYEGFRKQISFCGSEEYNGKIYFTAGDHGLCEYDIATDTIKSLKMETAIYGLRCGSHSLITLDDPLYPDKTIVTYRGDGVILYNPQSKNANYIVEMFDEENDGSGMNIISMTNGLPGSNEIYLGAFNTVNCTAIDLSTGKYKHEFEAVGAQTDAMLWYNGALYTGNYTNGALVRVNTEDKNRNVVLLSMNNDMYEQNRVPALAAGDGFLFGGTKPRTDTYDGCLAVVNLETLENWVVRNIVDGCSVTGLQYAGGLVFGATSYSGGTGTDGPKNSTVSSKIFVYDPIKREKVGELDPREYFDGLPQQVPYIDAIAIDPNFATNGRVWAMVSETLFYFTFDRDTGKFDVETVLSFGLSEFPSSNNRTGRTTQILFQKGWLYVSMGSKGGLHKVNMSDYSDHTRLNCVPPRCFVIAEDGNLYYSVGDAALHMYPLDVTEQDWQAAEVVDAKIMAIGTVTLQREADVIAARQAYDALPLKYKALVQCYETLQIAETDLLEAKIDAIGTVTKDSVALIESLQATYKALPAKEQKYVKNYAVLVQAKQAAQAITDKEMAAQVQKMVDGLATLGEITLEKEAQIVAVREAYTALTFIQRSMVNIDRLVAAETQIRKLRDEKIEYLKQLIAVIGEVTLEDEATIAEAMGIYNWLYLDERELVDYITLVAANKAIVPLQKEAAAAVDALILAIGDTIDHSSKDAIAAARKAYDALTPGAKQYVQNLELLTGAEALYAELGMNPTTLIIIIAVAGGVLLAAAAVIVVLVLKKKKAAAGEETPSGVEAEAEEVPVDPEV